MKSWRWADSCLAVKIRGMKRGRDILSRWFPKKNTGAEEAV